MQKTTNEEDANLNRKNQNRMVRKENESDVYQIDFAISFMAVLVIFFLIIPHNNREEDRVHTQIPYLSKDIKTLNFPLRTYRPIYDFKEVWVYYDHKLWRLNFKFIATRLMETDSDTVYYDFLDGSGSIEIKLPSVREQGNILPTQYVLTYRRDNNIRTSQRNQNGPSSLPDVVHDKIISLSEIFDQDGNMKKSITSFFKPPVLLFVGDRAPDEDLKYLLLALQNESISHEIDHSKWPFRYARHRHHFTLDQLYR